MSTRVEIRFRGQFRQQFSRIAPDGVLRLLIDGGTDPAQDGDDWSGSIRLSDLVDRLTALMQGSNVLPASVGAVSSDQFAFFVGGRLLRPDDCIQDGDVVHVLSPIIGG